MELIDLIFKVGTPAALLILAALSHRFVSRKEFEALRADTLEVKAAVILLTEQQKVNGIHDNKLVDLETRVRALEIANASRAQEANRR